MKNFVWISCLFLLISCAYPKRQGYKYVEKKILKGQEWRPLFKQDEQIFRARISFKERTFSGLIAAKKTDMGHRFAFFTEVGMTMFDLEVGKNSAQLHYCFEPLNRKALIKILENDFRRLTIGGEDLTSRVYKNGEELVMYKCKPEGDKLYLQTKQDKITEIFHPSIFPDQVKITTSLEDDRISINHKKIDLLIELINSSGQFN